VFLKLLQHFRDLQLLRTHTTITAIANSNTSKCQLLHRRPLLYLTLVEVHHLRPLLCRDLADLPLHLLHRLETFQTDLQLRVLAE